MIGDVKVKKMISEMVGRIIEERQPEKIILFGSYAYGEPTEDSDLDILMVAQERLNSEEVYKIQRELSIDFSIPLQLICVSGEEFLETKDIIGGITFPASKYGEILYEKS